MRFRLGIQPIARRGAADTLPRRLALVRRQVVASRLHCVDARRVAQPPKFVERWTALEGVAVEARKRLEIAHDLGGFPFARRSAEPTSEVMHRLNKVDVRSAVQPYRKCSGRRMLAF